MNTSSPIPDLNLAVDTRPTDWQEQAACRDCPDPDIFFPNRREAKGLQVLVQAIYCDGCPVRQECLEYGRSEEHGLWAGLGRCSRGRLLPKYDTSRQCRHGHPREPGKPCPTCRAKTHRRYTDTQQQSVA